MNADLIFWPMIIQALVTLVMYVSMSNARVAAVKAGRAKASDFRIPAATENEDTRVYAAAITNQYELPVLFFAVCLAAYASGNADAVMIVLAFAFAIIKSAHSYIHMTTNTLKHRRPIFMGAYGVCILMWLWFAVRLLIG